MIETETLCPNCSNFQNCLFRLTADLIAGEVPEDDRFAAEEAHKEISALRLVARDQGCPNVNDVNPDYHGKSQL